MRQGAERGETPADTEAEEVIRAVSAPLHYRMPAGGDPREESVADTAAQAAVTAARAGVLRTPDEPTFRIRPHGDGTRCYRARYSDRPEPGAPGLPHEKPTAGS